MLRLHESNSLAHRGERKCMAVPSRGLAVGKPHGNDMTVLVVEDDPDALILTLMVLRKLVDSRNIVVSRDGIEAIRYLFQSELPTPALILLDINLPLMSGFDVLDRIRSEKRTRGIPVFMLSSSTRDRDIRHSLEIGADLYFTKPLDMESFRHALREFCLFRDHYGDRELVA